MDTNNEFKEFVSITESIQYGNRYYKDWLKEFQYNEEFWMCCEFRQIEYEVLTEHEEYIEELKYKCFLNKCFSYYCGSDYSRALNQLCRYGDTMYSFNQNFLIKMKDTMENEINKFTVNENIIGYRTLNYKDLLNSLNLKKIKRGDIIEDRGFMGVGLVRKPLLESQPSYDTVMKIYIPASARAIYLYFISNRNKEQEMLFSLNTKLEVISNRFYFRRKRELECIIKL